MGQSVDLDKSDFPSHDPILAIREITGAAIATEDHTLVVLAAEVYSRDTMEDVRAEKSRHAYPEALTQHKRRYKNIVVIKAMDAADGVAIAKKLMIGFKAFNILITGSLVMSRHSSNITVSFGPQCPEVISNEDLAFAYLGIPNNKNKEIFTNCRQLNSAFVEHKSTYYQYRATLFESNLHVPPATIFTLFKLPALGYGFSLGNEAGAVSAFIYFASQCVNSGATTVNTTLKKVKIINRRLSPRRHYYSNPKKHESKRRS